MMGFPKEQYETCLLYTSYVGGTADSETQNETTMNEDVESLETKQQDQTAGK